MHPPPTQRKIYTFLSGKSVFFLQGQTGKKSTVNIILNWKDFFFLKSYLRVPESPRGLGWFSRIRRQEMWQYRHPAWISTVYSYTKINIPTPTELAIPLLIYEICVDLHAYMPRPGKRAQEQKLVGRPGNKSALPVCSCDATQPWLSSQGIGR